MFLPKLVIIWLVLGFVSPLQAELLFDDDPPLEIELTGQLWSLIDKKETGEEWPFHIRTRALELDLKVKARGNSRMRVCDFPPLRLNFKKSETSVTLFEGQDKLKLVTRCKAGDRSEQDVLEEYAAYQIFSLLSDVSFRVRLVHVKYNDTDDRIKESFKSSYGFLIEPLDQLVSRVDGSLTEIPAVALGQIEEKQAALVYVYQYLIANTDWSFVAGGSEEFCCHNIRLVEIGAKLFPVPYDFDLAGIVSASYARPDASFGISRVSQRLYRGFCTGPDVLRGALDAISSKEREILGVIANLPMLTEKEKDRRMDYLKKFFKKAGNQDRIIKHFERKCHP
jgi:hypothetical protein